LLTRLALIATLASSLQAKSVEDVLDAADKTLEEARKSYEAGKASGSLADLTGAAFLAEEARIKFQAAQEFAFGASQTRAASQFRVAGQLLKLINAARKAAGPPAGGPPRDSRRRAAARRCPEDAPASVAAGPTSVRAPCRQDRGGGKDPA
jgi:hypothetical protein